MKNLASYLIVGAVGWFVGVLMTEHANIKAELDDIKEAKRLNSELSEELDDLLGGKA